MILIGLGANLPSAAGAPRATLEAALAALARDGVRLAARSRWYRSAPLPRSSQPDFVNGVAAVETRLAPRDLLALLHRIEARLGRARGEPNAARTIDLDLLGTAELSIEARKRLLAALQQHFVPLRPTRSVHPRDVLDTRSGPFPVRPPSGMAFLKETVIQRLIKPMLGRKPNVYQPVHLAVEGLVLIRAPY